MKPGLLGAGSVQREVCLMRSPSGAPARPSSRGGGSHALRSIFIAPDPPSSMPILRRRQRARQRPKRYSPPRAEGTCSPEGVMCPEMATTGDRFDMPDGSAYIVRRAAAETGGEYVEMEFVLPPGCVPPPPHIHPQQVEGVRGARRKLRRDGRRTVADPRARGVSLCAAGGAPHVQESFRGRRSRSQLAPRRLRQSP